MVEEHEVLGLDLLRLSAFSDGRVGITPRTLMAIPWLSSTVSSCSPVLEKRITAV